MAEPAKSFLFGPYHLDMGQLVLLRDGKPVSLPPKAMTILCVLVENHGKLVEREELMQRVWPNVFVEDGNLTVNVFALRKVLAEGLSGACPIETIPKRGYRFTAEVETKGTPADVSPPTEPMTGNTGTRGIPAGQGAGPGGWMRHGALGVVAVLLFGILATGIFLHFSRSPTNGRTPRVSLAVLPFLNLTGNPANDYLADSLTAEMIARFARDYGGDLRVIALDSVLSYKERKRTAPQIASELSVQYLIQGSVGSEGKQIRVAAKLLRAADQKSLWADSYQGDQSQLLGFEEGVVGSVAKELSLKLGVGRAHEYVPSSSEAHDDYLRGLYYLSRRSRPGLEQALESFAAATVGDPHYARAYARLAVTYNLMGGYSWINSRYAHNLGKAAAQQAIAADPSLSEAHAALGFSMWFYEWNPAAGERELLRAIQLNPDNVDAHHWYSQALMTSGRFTEAEQQMHAALALDPKSLILRTNLGWLYYFERRYGLAIEELKSVVRDDPDFVTAHYKLWEVYSVSGEKTNASKEFQRLVRLLCSPENEKKILFAYGQRGYPTALKSLASVSPADYSGSYVDASRYMIFAGDQARAMNFLERAYREKDGWMVFVPIDPAFDALRADSRFARIKVVAQSSFNPSY